MASEIVDAVQEKVNEYRVLVAPMENAIREIQHGRGLLRARAEDEIQQLSPALAALTDALGVSTLDLLTAKDRSAFLQDAVLRCPLTVEEIHHRIRAAGIGAGDELRALGLPEATG